MWQNAKTTTALFLLLIAFGTSSRHALAGTDYDWTGITLDSFSTWNEIAQLEKQFQNSPNDETEKRIVYLTGKFFAQAVVDYDLLRSLIGTVVFQDPLSPHALHINTESTAKSYEALKDWIGRIGEAHQQILVSEMSFLANAEPVLRSDLKEARHDFWRFIVFDLVTLPTSIFTLQHYLVSGDTSALYAALCSGLVAGMSTAGIVMSKSEIKKTKQLIGEITQDSSEFWRGVAEVEPALGSLDGKHNAAVSQKRLKWIDGILIKIRAAALAAALATPSPKSCEKQFIQ